MGCLIKLEEDAASVVRTYKTKNTHNKDLT
jgi:hypothetical protein